MKRPDRPPQATCKIFVLDLADLAAELSLPGCNEEDVVVDPLEVIAAIDVYLQLVLACQWPEIPYAIPGWSFCELGGPCSECMYFMGHARDVAFV